MEAAAAPCGRGYLPEEELPVTYRESIEWLFSTQLFGIKLGLDGPKRLLKEYLAYPAFGVKVVR